MSNSLIDSLLHPTGLGAALIKLFGIALSGAIFDVGLSMYLGKKTNLKQMWAMILMFYAAWGIFK
jgi:hypothetical protein